MKQFFFSAIVLAMFSGAVLAQPIERAKLTDNDLNCQQVYLEIAQMDALIAKNATVPVAGTQVADAGSAPGVGAGVVGAVAQEAVARSGFGGFGGFGGGLGGMFGGIAQSLAQGAAAQQAAQAGAAQQAAAAAQQNQTLVTQQAQGRKEHLTGMFLSKGCKMGDIQK